MAANNNITIVGKLGKDPEVKGEGTSKKASFSVAVTRTRKAADGTYPTDWFNAVVWGKQAEIAENFLKKGKTVAVSGTYQIDKYTDKQGNPKEWSSINVDSFQMVGPKDADSSSTTTTVEEDDSSFEDDSDVPPF